MCIAHPNSDCFNVAEVSLRTAQTDRELKKRIKEGRKKDRDQIMSAGDGALQIDVCWRGVNLQLRVLESRQNIAGLVSKASTLRRSWLVIVGAELLRYLKLSPVLSLSQATPFSVAT